MHQKTFSMRGAEAYSDIQEARECIKDAIGLNKELAIYIGPNNTKDRKVLPDS
jgi:hypothetical protein